MKKLSLWCVGIWCLAMLPQWASSQTVEGAWKGVLKTEMMDLRVGIVLEAKGAGWSAKMDLLDQGMKGLPLTKVEFADSLLTFEINGGRYEGHLSGEGKIQGNLDQAGTKTPLDFERGQWVVNRPQEPKAPFPYTIEEVSYPNAFAEGVALAGTLTVPEGPGPYPAVVLISGSGPSNRDEEILMHKPFWVLADYLSRHGVAVLRFDDRGVGQSTGKHALATAADFATDALAGVAYLKGRKDLKLSKIGLAGHSEGGVIGPLAAVQSTDVGFVVLLAGTGVNGAILLGEQTELVMRAMGSSDDAVKRARANNEAMYRIIVKSKSIKQAKAKLEKWVVKAAKKDTSIHVAEYKAMFPQMNNVWIRYFLKHDPAPVLEKVKCPVLAVNGGEDVQVPSDMNLTAIEAALKRGGNTDVTIKNYPGLNHLFQRCTTCAVSEYAVLEETFSQEVMEAVGKWILEKGR